MLLDSLISHDPLSEFILLTKDLDHQRSGSRALVEKYWNPPLNHCKKKKKKSCYWLIYKCYTKSSHQTLEINQGGCDEGRSLGGSMLPWGETESRPHQSLIMKPFVMCCESIWCCLGGCLQPGEIYFPTSSISKTNGKHRFLVCFEHRVQTGVKWLMESRRKINALCGLCVTKMLHQPKSLFFSLRSGKKSVVNVQIVLFQMLMAPKCFYVRSKRD